MLMVFVPAGEFLMGATNADQNAEGDEKPQRSVYLDPFYISQYPVTNEQFTRFVDAAGYRTTAEREGAGWVWTGQAWELVQGANWRQPRGSGSGIAGKMDHPVVQVTWDDANAYCRWADKRLPTEAEWEKAARGTAGWIYPWGNEPPDGGKLNFCDANCEIDWAVSNENDGYADTSPVGQYEAGKSPYGAYDMAGNVWEWVADWYGQGYYAGAPGRNPQGPAAGEQRVTRGGSWYNQPWLGRSAFRTGLDPDVRDYSIGFRCALAAAPSTPAATPTPAPESGAPLSLSHSIAQVSCISTSTYQVRFVLRVDGGTGTHTVYRDVESQSVYGPGAEREFTYDLEWGAGYAAVGTFHARSGNMSAESKFYVNAPNCEDS
jgi:formylglycine-generating enzyme required for sulfatase activity